MSRPRFVTPGKVYHLTRRTTRRYMLLTPDEHRQVETIFWYSLATAAARCGVLIHAACLMSTHIHIVLTDVEGRHPDFTREFHRSLANSLKVYRRWPEEVFNKTGTSMTELLTPQAIERAIGYVIANPVSAFLVRYARDWPGPQTDPIDIGRRRIQVKRPPYWFRSENARWPQTIELELVMPEALERHYGSAAVDRIAGHVSRLEHVARRRSESERRSVLGAKRAKRQHHTQRASSYERFGGTRPRFSAAGNRRAASGTVNRLRRFYSEYAEALTAWRQGKRSIEFPNGTWAMRVTHNVSCRPPP